MGKSILVDFDNFYLMNYDRLRRVMVLTFRDPDLAEDITQEAFLQALKRWKNISKMEHPEAWTTVVALNKGRDFHRRRKRHEIKQALLVQQTEPQSDRSQVDDRIFIAGLLDKLSNRQREFLLLRYAVQLTIPEIAVAMNCAEGTVKATLHSALSKASIRLKEIIDVAE